MFRQKDDLWNIKNLGIVLVLLAIFMLLSFKLLTEAQLNKGIQLRVREFASKNIKIINYQAKLYQKDLELTASELRLPISSEQNQITLLQMMQTNSFDQMALYSSNGQRIYGGTMDNENDPLNFPAKLETNETVFLFEDSICMLYPLGNSKDSPSGYLLGQVSKERFSKESQMADYSHMGFANIVTKEGIPLIISSDKSSLQLMDNSFWDVFSTLSFKNPYSFDRLKDQIEKSRSGYTYYYTKNGNARIAYFAPVGIADWYIFQVATQDAIDLHSNPVKRVMFESAILITVIMLVTFATVYLLNNRHTKKLTEAQNQVERLTNAIRGGVIRFSANEQGNIEYISEGYLRILHAEPDDLDTKYKNSFYEMIYEEDRENVRAQIGSDDLFHDREINLEYRLIRKDGSPIWVIDKMTVVKESSGVFKFYSIVIDATVVKKTEDDLRSTNENLKLVADTHMESRVFEYDVETGVINFHKGNFLGYNLEDYTGFTIDTMSQWSWADDNVTAEMERMRKEMSDGNEFSSGIIRIAHANSGDPRWVRIMLTRVNDNESYRVIGSVRDVTEEKEIQLKLSRETERNKLMISGALFTGTINVSQNSITINSDAKGLRISDSISYNYIRRLQFIVGTYVHPEDVEIFLSEFNIESIFRNYNKGNVNRSVEYRRRINGRSGYYWVRATMRIIKEVSSGDILCFVYVNDIDHDIKITQMLRQKAETDYLTGLFNRDGLISRIEDYLKNFGENEIGAFYSMDLDDFKTLNDNYGHLEGDNFLKIIGAELTKMFRKDDLIGRMGGDEFVVFLKNCPDEAFVEKKAQAILDKISSITMDGIDHQSHASIGVAISPMHGKSFQDLYDASDKALYESKKKGKNIYSVYQPKEEEDQ